MPDCKTFNKIQFQEMVYFQIKISGFLSENKFWHFNCCFKKR